MLNLPVYGHIKDIATTQRERNTTQTNDGTFLAEKHTNKYYNSRRIMQIEEQRIYSTNDHIISKTMTYSRYERATSNFTQSFIFLNFGPNICPDNKSSIWKYYIHKCIHNMSINKHDV